MPVSRKIKPQIGEHLASLDYVGKILRKQKAIAQIPEEPQSPPRCLMEVDNDAHDERIKALRERVQDAWVKADGNPSDGRWTFLTDLLQLGTTTGRNGHWAGARTDLKPTDQLPGRGWVNAETESEWAVWEQEYNEERRLKDKVENWKKQVEPHSINSVLGVTDLSQTPAILPSAASKASDPSEPAPPNVISAEVNLTSQEKVQETVNVTAVKSSTSKLKATPSVSSLVDPLKDTAPFGFSVVKRPIAQKIATGKPSASGKSKPSKKQPDAEQKDAAGASKRADKPEILPGPTRNENIQHIGDISEMSFLPPSFPSSVIMTSTPKANMKPPSKSRKPDAIPAIPVSASPSALSSSSKPVFKPIPSSSHPQVPKTPLEAAASLPAIPSPSTPTRNTHSTKPTFQYRLPPTPNKDVDTNPKNINANNKRVFPTSPITPHEDSRVMKKARTMPTFTLMHSPKSSPHPAATAATRRALELQLMGRKPLPNPRTPESPQRPASRPVVVAKAVSMASPAASSSSPLTSLPTTPSKPALPTLTDLLASSKKGKVTSSRKSPLKPSRKGKERQRHQLEPQAQKKVAESEVDPDSSGFPELPSMPSFPTRPIDPYADDLNFNDDIVADTNNPYIFDPYAIDAEVDISPTKSLSSLAGSDSEDEIEEDYLGRPATGFSVNLSPGFLFKPPVTSTQQRGPFLAAGAATGTGNDHGTQLSRDSWGSVYGPSSNPHLNHRPTTPKSSHPSFSYNSQFESNVAKQVDMVSKLLDRDVDYGGWLRDPSEEPAAAVDESP